MKKFISIAVAATMLAGSIAAFAGCGEIKLPEVNWDVDLTKPIELRGLFPNAGMKAFGKDDTAKIIERETGYKVKYEELASQGMESTVGNYLGTREKFNFMKLNDGCYTPYLEKGYFLDLTDLLEKTPEGQVLYQLIDLMDYGWEAVTYTDSKGEKHIYGIPDFGYVHMIDTALIWNTNHLEQIGFEEKYNHALPETLSEVTWAFETLQKKFNPKGDGNYHAFGVPGAASAEVNPIAACFEVPNQFFVDKDGSVKIKNLSDNMTDYVQYMNYLYNYKIDVPGVDKPVSSGILSSNWNNSDSKTVNQIFAQGLHSCIAIPYWYVTPLVDAIVDHGVIAKAMGVANDFQTMHDEAIAWTLRIRGDGYTFKNVNGEDVSCKTQEKALLPGDPGGVSYYTVIPAYMAENARYVIDYLAKKMEAFGAFFGGDEGVHWNEIDAPAGAPKAEDYTEENDAEFTAHESFKDMICFVRPYSYEYKDARSGEEKTVTVKEEGKLIKLTEQYAKGQIADNSQYCTGTNAKAAKVYCHLHELGFNAWYYCDNFADPSEWISNPMFMAPTMRLWAPVNIDSRSFYLTGVENAIRAKDPLNELAVNRAGALQKFNKVDGVYYFYWSDDVSAEMTAWYNANRKIK